MKVLPQNLHVFKLKSVFVRILLFFILLIFISVLLLGFISYGYSSGLLVKEVMDANLLLIKQVQSDIDKEIGSLDRLTFQLSLQPKIKAALYASGDDWTNDQVVYTEAIRTIHSIRASNQIIAGIWVYLFKSDVILNDSFKFSSSFFFKEVCSYKEQVDWDVLKQRHPNFISLGRQPVVAESKQQTYISFARSISVDDVQPQGIACINVNEDAFSNILNGINKKIPSFTYVVDDSGAPVLSSTVPANAGKGSDLLGNLMHQKDVFTSDEGYLRKKIDGKEYLVVFTTSQISGWRYITMIPTGVVTEKAGKIRQITIAAAFLCLLLGFAFAYVLTGRIYYPINEMVNYINAFRLKRRIGEGEAAEDEWTFINRIINYVYNENENLKDLFEQNKPVLREKFIYDLLDGKLLPDEFAGASGKLGLEFAFKNYEVLVFEIEKEGADGRRCKAGVNMEKKVDEIAVQKYSGRIQTCTLRRGRDKILVLLNLDSHSQASEIIYDFIREIKSCFADQFGLVLTVGIGNSYSDPGDIPLSFMEALSALKYKVVKGQGSITHIDEISNLPAHIFEYSMETEKQMINLIKTGNQAGFAALLDEVVRANINPPETSPEIVDNLFNALAGTAVRTVYEARASVTEIFGGKRDIYKELREENKIGGKKEYILEFYRTVSNYISSRKQNQNNRIMEKAKEYIERCYPEDLSLPQVAEAVGLSSTYVSSIFKEISGENFVDYLNRIRIEKSKELLLQSEVTIAQIAEKVGFGSSNTFIKAFKRYEGITPGQFRESKV